jgi:hypothetical protein
MTNRRVVLLIALIWGLAIFMGLVPTMGWHCLCDLENCSTMAPMYKRSYLVFWAVLNLFTFSLMVAAYTRIFVYVRHKSQRMSQHTSQIRHKETVFNLMKTVSMILGEEGLDNYIYISYIYIHTYTVEVYIHLSQIYLNSVFHNS